MSSLIQTKKLSHIALKSADVAAQTDFYTQMVGLEVTDSTPNGSVYLRCGGDHHAVELIPAQEKGFDHFALDLGGMAHLEAAATALAQRGIPHGIVSDATGQKATIQLADPDGFTIELVAGMEQVEPHYGPRAVHPRRFGHLTLRVADPKRTADFYTSILGFRVSDWLGDQFAWLRCTPEHHGIAVSKHERAPMVHHLSFHVKDMAELVHQAEHLMHNGRTLLYGPGRHGPGGNLFIYFHDVEENIVEFAADMERIWDEENYVPKVWDPNERWSNMWGPPSLPAFRE